MFHTFTLALMIWLISACNGDLSVSSSALAKIPKITSMDAIEASPGEIIAVKGLNFSPKVQFAVEGKSFDWILADEKTASIILPNELPEGVFLVTFTYEGKILSRIPIFNKSSQSELVKSGLKPESVCDTYLFRNEAGDLVRGTRSCGGAAKTCSSDGETDCLVTGGSAKVAGLAAKVLSGQTVAGVSGMAETDLPDCTADGEGLCVVDGTQFKSADVLSLTASDIRDGVTLAGVTGNLSGYPLRCHQDNETSCIASQAFPAIDKIGVVSPNLSKLRNTFTIAGLSGTIASCSVDGDNECVSIGPTFAAGATSGAEAKILLGSTVALIDGTVPVKPIDCSTDAQTACTAVAMFPAVKKADLTANQDKYATSLTLAGLPGSLANCNSDGQSSCLTGSNFPAIHKTNLQNNVSKIRSSLTIAGLPGTLNNCSADGEVGCYSITNFPAFQKSTAAPKIVSPETLGLVSGTGAGRPENCAVDGGLDCVATSSFPAMEKSTAAAKIVTNTTVGGVSGSAAVRPSDCLTNGDTDCVTTASFPAVVKAFIQANVAKIKSTLNVAGTSGTLDDCAEAGVGCVAKSPDFAAAETAGAAAKIIQNETVAGFGGTALPKQANCNSDGQISCVADGAFPAVNTAIAGARIIDSEILANVQGLAVTPRPLDCVSDGELSCVSLALFPAMKKADAAPKIKNGMIVGGETGTASIRPSDCNAGDDVACVATSSFPAVDKTRLSANLSKFANSLILSGLNGSIPDCATDGQNSCLSSSAFPAAAVAGAAGKILSGQVLAGVSGNAALTPAACAASGSSACVTSATYPSIDKTTLNASANKLASSLSLLGVTGSINDCSSDGQTSCVAVSNFPAALTTGATTKIMNLQTVAGVAGSAALKPSDCSSDGSIDCVTVTNFPAVKQSDILAGKIRRNTSIAGVAGTLDDCSADGSVGCVAHAAYPAALVAGAAAKVIASNTLAGESGTAIVKPANCSSENLTECVAVPSFPSIDTTALAAKAAKIRSSNSVLSVNGSLIDCAADGHTDCVTNASYPAALTTGAEAKILTPNTLAGIVGTASPKPSDCSTENQADCVATTGFPAVIKSNVIASSMHTSLTVAGVTGSIPTCTGDNLTQCLATTSYPSAIKLNITEGVLKNGITLAGVTGLYPSATYKLAGSTATADLGGLADFTAKLASGDAFQFFDSAGNRQQATGDANLTAANIKNGVSLFGIYGTYNPPSDCASDGATSCTTTSTWKAANTTGLSDMDVRNGTTVAGQNGLVFFANNGVDLAFFNRISGYEADASTTNADPYDTIDDSKNFGAFPFNGPSIWWPASNWIWHFFDPNGNGTCDSGERCEFFDRFTKLSWIFITNPATWEDAVLTCSTAANGGFDGGRLPTQKEFLQASINGIEQLRSKDSRITSANSFWTGTADRNAKSTKVWVVATQGYADTVNRTTSHYFACVKWGPR